METNLVNASILRRQIMTSSPELRTLESQLQACALTRDNRAAVAEKEARRRQAEVSDRQYAELLEHLGTQEKISSALTSAARYVEKQENQRVLQEQIAEKTAAKTQMKAERTVEMMSEVNEEKLLRKEKEEQLKKKLKNREITREFLLKQTQLKELHHQAEELWDRNMVRAAEEHNLRVDLQKELNEEEQEMQKLRMNQLELTLVKQLEKQQQQAEAVRELRLEVGLLEKAAQEKQFAEEKKKKEEEAKLRLKEGWDSQLRYKQEEQVKEQKKEDEYRKMLLEVLAEEAKLDLLVSEARKRRQLDHRFLVEALLEERRAMRATLMRRHREEDRQMQEYEQLRKNILEEEEKQLLLRHAPYLMPYFTPKLLTRLRALL